jgi:hypothetical protein
LKQSFFAVLIALSIALPASAGDRGSAPTVLPSGFYQWTFRGYATLPEAAAVLSAAASDPKSPVLIDTKDGLVSTFGNSTPWVVFRWENVDLWCCSPAHFNHVRPATKSEAMWALDLYCDRLFPGRKCGINGVTFGPYGGEWIVWNTTP